MPVPWSTERRCTYIPKVADRGLKVKQLWDLALFLKRLCKTKSLVNPDLVPQLSLKTWRENGFLHVVDHVWIRVFSLYITSVWVCSHHCEHSVAHELKNARQRELAQASGWTGKHWISMTLPVRPWWPKRALFGPVLRRACLGLATLFGVMQESEQWQYERKLQSWEDAICKPFAIFAGSPRFLNVFNTQHAWIQVIKKYIPYHDLQWAVNEEDPEIARRYSWAELVSAEPQRPQLMISHWWGGRFRDFMTVVDKVVLDRRDKQWKPPHNSHWNVLLPSRSVLKPCSLTECKETPNRRCSLHPSTGFDWRPICHLKRILRPWALVPDQVFEHLLEPLGLHLCDPCHRWEVGAGFWRKGRWIPKSKIM